jgi:hypothetical protein
MYSFVIYFRIEILVLTIVVPISRPLFTLGFKGYVVKPDG